MSVGGTVIEVVWTKDKIWVNTDDHGDECAIYVEPCFKAKCVCPGDKLWWQGSFAYWTPQSHVEGTGDYDIKIRRIGGSGVSRPKDEDIVND